MKNTMVLYARMLFTMAVGFYTTRKFLSALGVVDYGLVNVISGVASMFSFLSGMMASATSRFLNFELGKHDTEQTKRTFNLIQIIYLGLILVLLVLSESVGVWFFKSKVVIPPGREVAAFWFFQFSVVTFLLNIATIPYSSLIISHENMRAYAWISIMDAFAKLGVVYLLVACVFDKLIVYGSLLSLMSTLMFVTYYIVCRSWYEESRFDVYWDRKRFFEILHFGGWNLFGSMSGLFSNVLVNVLINNMFGASVIAARGISNQVSSSLSGFTLNFLTATRPQIVKYYASGDMHQAYLLTMRSARMGFFLLFFFAMPAMIELEFVLKLWLKDVPAHTVAFSRLVLIQMLIDSFSYPLMTLAQATGRIALYQAVVGGMLWMTLPFSYLFMRMGYPPEVTAKVAIGVSVVCLGLRLILVRRCAKLPVRAFVAQTLVPACSVGLVAAALPLVFVMTLSDGWLRFFCVGFACVLGTTLSVFSFGLMKEERSEIVAFTKNRLRWLMA